MKHLATVACNTPTLQPPVQYILLIYELATRESQSREVLQGTFARCFMQDQTLPTLGP